MTDTAVWTEGTGIMTGASGIGVGLHITGGDLFHKTAKHTENITFQKLQLITVCQVAGIAAIFFDSIAQPRSGYKKRHSRKNCCASFIEMFS